MMGFHAMLLFSCLALGCSSIEDCDDIKSRARALVAEFAACDAGRSCVVVDLGRVVENACLGDFQCFTALAEGSDLDELSRRARALEQEFARCGECAKSECARPEGWTAFCDVAQSRCLLRVPE
jgi:hypothetical protein